MTQSDPSDAPTLEVLYFDGCPNHERAVALVRQALAAEQMTAPIQLIRVETDAEAQQYSFYGSPTIRINGVDVAPMPAGATPRLACRVYQRADGRLAPVPSYDAIRAAVRQALHTG